MGLAVGLVNGAKPSYLNKVSVITDYFSYLYNSLIYVEDLKVINKVSSQNIKITLHDLYSASDGLFCFFISTTQSTARLFYCDTFLWSHTILRVE